MSETEDTIEPGTFVDRVNAEAGKAREAIVALVHVVENLSNSQDDEDAATWLTITAMSAEVRHAYNHLENARLRILDFARQTDDA